MTLRRRLMLAALGAALGLAVGGLTPLPEAMRARGADPAAPTCGCLPPAADLRIA